MIYLGIFFIFSFIGWIIELFYRRFISYKHWVNPGFLKGPILPIYGIGAIFSFFMTTLDSFSIFTSLLHIFILGVLFSFLEFLSGYLLLKIFHIRLWDYRNVKGNILGLICPKYSLIWLFIGGLSYYLIMMIKPFLFIILNHDFFINLMILCSLFFLLDLLSALHFKKRLFSSKKASFFSYIYKIGKNITFKTKHNFKEKYQNLDYQHKFNLFFHVVFT